jgi:hypothetical protein
MNLSKFNDFDHVLGRLQRLTLSSLSVSSLTSPSSLNHCSDSPKSRSSLDAPFAMSYSSKDPDEDDGPTIIDTFAPRPLMFDLSPTSSASSDFDSISSHTSFPRSSFDAFVATRSRVVRVCGAPECLASPLTSIPADQLYNLPGEPEAILGAVFLPQSVSLSFFFFC